VRAPIGPRIEYGAAGGAHGVLRPGVAEEHAGVGDAVSFMVASVVHHELLEGGAESGYLPPTVYRLGPGSAMRVGAERLGRRPDDLGAL